MSGAEPPAVNLLVARCLDASVMSRPRLHLRNGPAARRRELLDAFGWRRDAHGKTLGAAWSLAMVPDRARAGSGPGNHGPATHQADPYDGGMAVTTRRVLLAAPRILRRGRPGRSGGREGAGAVRPSRVRPQADRAQHARRGDAGNSAARSSSTRPTRCPEGAVVLLRTRRRPRRSRGGHRRRRLKTIDAPPAGHQGAQRGPAIRRPGLDILLIGHEGHEEVAAPPARPRPRPAGGRSRATSPASRCATRRRSSGCPRPRCRWTRHETVAALDERFPLLIDPPSDDICYTTQNRQAAVKRIAPSATWSSWWARRTRPIGPPGRGGRGRRGWRRLPGRRSARASRRNG